MFILLSGELAVKTQDGTQVATLSPVTTVGELGVLTNQERKATVETVGSSALLQITRTGFEKMLQANPGRAGEGVSQHRRNPGKRDRR